MLHCHRRVARAGSATASYLQYGGLKHVLRYGLQWGDCPVGASFQSWRLGAGMCISGELASGRIAGTLMLKSS